MYRKMHGTLAIPKQYHNNPNITAMASSEDYISDSAARNE